MAEYTMDELRLTGMPGENPGDVWKMPRTKVDSTLTQSGQAADAKKTGDEISALKEDLTDLGLSVEDGVLCVEFGEDEELEG